MFFRLARRALRRATAIFFGLLLGSRLFQRARSSAEPRRVLVIRIDERVGNVLLTAPLLTALRSALPAAKIDALIAASKTILVEGLAHVIPFERRDFFRRPFAFARALMRLRREHYDVAIDASHWHELSVTSAMLLAWTGAPIRIAHDRKEAHLFATRLVPPPAPEVYELDAKRALLDPLALSIPDPPRLVTRLGENGSAHEKIRAWLEAHDLTKTPLVALAPGSRKPDHRIAPELFARFATHARALGATPLVLWGPGEEALAAQVLDASSASRSILAPPTDLAELAALMRACRAVITNDTGPMHLAVACGAPTIALFVHGDHHRWGHAHPPNVVIPAADKTADRLEGEVAAAIRKMLE